MKKWRTVKTVQWNVQISRTKVLRGLRGLVACSSRLLLSSSAASRLSRNQPRVWTLPSFTMDLAREQWVCKVQTCWWEDGPRHFTTRRWGARHLGQHRPQQQWTSRFPSSHRAIRPGNQRPPLRSLSGLCTRLPTHTRTPRQGTLSKNGRTVLEFGT